MKFFAARRSWNIRAGLPAGLPRETPTSPPDKAAPLEKEFTPHPRQEVHYEAPPLSKHDLTRPIDCRTPIRPHKSCESGCGVRRSTISVEDHPVDRRAAPTYAAAILIASLASSASGAPTSDTPAGGVRIGPAPP